MTLNEKANEEVAFLELGDVVIETYENKNAALKSGALDHLALDTSDIQGAYRLAKERAAEFWTMASSSCRFGRMG